MVKGTRKMRGTKGNERGKWGNRKREERTSETESKEEREKQKRRTGGTEKRRQANVVLVKLIHNFNYANFDQ